MLCLVLGKETFYKSEEVPLTFVFMKITLLKAVKDIRLINVIAKNYI